MGKEIEYRYLVTGSAWHSAVTRERKIIQGYFDHGDGYCVRVRVVDSQSGYLTIKSAFRDAVAGRSEYEYSVPLKDARDMMMDFCKGRVLTKTRYDVLHCGHLWEIDEFHGASEGLVIAEIELERADESYELPDWLGESITGKHEYSNIFLASHGWRQ